eukprot:CAMPEP_0171105432 /NCGR_PEP_ID=MMETSP0766_2-20121228/62672_1 /TAXON_ID=439317 /ORGANISM="Gambierdiscus australes, Strain CAWD 149" /LENGTH=199 /DNA_ID=CAMNT_0011566285 /DNA_START=68 /DNA_END=667 /DNA_ORIENTATION=+
MEIRTLRALALPFAFFLAAVHAEESSLKGEFGQAVYGCTCKGGKTTHGYCGYHFHWGSKEDQPWCRTKYGCGFTGLAAWKHCDARGVERRRADDGQFYTSKEFKDFYGDKGKKEWTGKEEHIERRVARNKKAYTVYEFRDYYVDALGEEGWVTEWVSAGPEQRRAQDGKWWTWEQFVQFYGDKESWYKWTWATTASSEL